MADKSYKRWVVFSGAAFAALAAAGAHAQGRGAERARYELVDLGTLGGPTSVVTPLTVPMNSRGTVTPCADTRAANPNVDNSSPAYDPPHAVTSHATVSANGWLMDLGALPGGSNSCSQWINDHGAVVGSSENGAIDPLTGYPEVRAVLWDHGVIRDLGTLGGPESLAFAINNHGDVVGFAENGIPDPFVESVFVFGAAQTHATLWRDGATVDLGTLGGPNSVAFNVNDRGQVAGISNTGTVADPTTGFPVVHSFFWEDGAMTDLGTLGGTSSAQNNMNNRGQVVGLTDLAGDAVFHPYLWSRGALTDLGTFGGKNGEARWINDAGSVVGWAELDVACPGCRQPGEQEYHGAFWQHGKMIDLGAVPGDRCSVAEFVNASGQVVGASGICHGARNAFLWEDGGPMVNLNSLVPAGSALHLTGAVSINDRGEITGTGVVPNGDVHAFLLRPR